VKRYQDFLLHKTFLWPINEGGLSTWDEVREIHATPDGLSTREERGVQQIHATLNGLSTWEEFYSIHTVHILSALVGGYIDFKWEEVQEIHEQLTLHTWDRVQGIHATPDRLHT
jgi:hypothetical protein